MTAVVKADLCIIGAGSAGLSVAAGAAQMGARTVLIERGRMGGDCLNYGCVPSKSLIAAGRLAAIPARSPAFGVSLGPPVIDGAAVHRHVEEVIREIAPHDSVERFESLGVRVIAADARFAGRREVVAGDKLVRARRFVIASGSLPTVPPIAGLASTPFLTNETVFDLEAVPSHLIILGGGPVGTEMAHAQRRLGARVTLLQRSTLLPRDDPELVGVVRARLLADGVDVRERVRIVRTEGISGAHGTAPTDAVRVVVAGDGGEQTIAGSHLLVAAGRRPNIDGLALDAAGITSTPQGIVVDRRLRTSNRRVFAIGDVTGGMQFTHVAGYHAAIVIKNALFRWPARADHRCVPWVTYTDPELAQVGLTESAAQGQRIRHRVLRATYATNDRARTERRTDGLIKVVVGRGGHILGAGIVGEQAGELIHTWVLAMSQRLKIGAVATMIAPYPTLGELNKNAAGTYFTPSLFSPQTRRLVRFLARFG
jgi:pyruvate/2-oxoglutarate dehydrogenase complex dihydrolipoamide dehydrogenase (E3) component